MPGTSWRCSMSAIERSIVCAGSASGSTPHSRSMSRTWPQRRRALAAQRQEPLPHPRDRIRGEGDGHERVQRPARPGDGGVEEHEPVHRLRRGRGLQDRDHPAHRVADEDDGRAGDLPQEAVEDLHVVVHRRPPVAGLAAAEAGQVDAPGRGRAARAAARTGPSSGATRRDRGRAPPSGRPRGRRSRRSGRVRPDPPSGSVRRSPASPLSCVSSSLSSVRSCCLRLHGRHVLWRPSVTASRPYTRNVNGTYDPGHNSATCACEFNRATCEPGLILVHASTERFGSRRHMWHDDRTTVPHSRCT